ncbi:hypothetical protein [Pedobacter jeongneungensis]|uniref:hypothetical protein n=1 Tax=Pedobacter jeongneungensis TaxID=947309 RepID=UPI00046A8547|nr:hypothetical protein [Pedobacter jeongneungensis]
MKKYLIMLWVVIMFLGFISKANAQTDEIAQLALNIEKLAQLKSILTDLKKGYTIVSNGYGTIKNISEGNFNMHELFLDGLLQVSPAVQKYYKVAGIINYQVRLVKVYKSAFNRFKTAGCFNPKEIEYISGVYGRLTSESLRNLDDLANVVTANKLRMSDDERIREIDRIYADMEDKTTFLKSFNSSTSMLVIQRRKQLSEIEGVRKMSDIK